MASSAHPKRLGRYEIVELLAQGGMAELFLARLPGIEGFAKHVVVKRVLPSLARDREFIEMFVEEARLAATLHHQNIVQVHDIGHDDDGYFFAMEYLHGADLGEVLREVGHGGGVLPLEIALEIARASCAGLHYAHERKNAAGAPQGIVHRDVSPQNLFVTFEGGIKLLDFGIAKAVQQIASPYTRSGTLRGKLPYMSPEQCNAERIDRRSDVFSLAVVLWEMTVGQRLFGGDGQGDFEVLKSIVEHDAPAPSSRRAGYPPALEAIVMKGLRRDRRARHQTCDELQAELEGFMRSTGRWGTARDVGAFMRAQFADRAASSLRLAVVKDEPGGELVMFPRTEPVVASKPVTMHDRPSRPSGELAQAAAASPSPTPTPTPALIAAAPPPSQAPSTAAAPLAAPAAASPSAAAAPRPTSTVDPSPSGAPPAAISRGLGRTIALVAGTMVATALVMGIGFLVGSRRGEAPKVASSATRDAGTSSDAHPVKPAEDELWFAPDDYFVSATPFRDGRLWDIHVAKRIGAARAGKTEFLTSSGHSVSTQFFWTTHLATLEELAIGRLAFCKPSDARYDRTAPAPDDRDGARIGSWMVGRITDIAEVSADIVTVADCRCAIAGVRLVDDPQPGVQNAQ